MRSVLHIFLSIITVQCLPTDRAKWSGQREEADERKGKVLGPQNSFHNCKNRGGKCCAKNKGGTGGLDASAGQRREDCGFCFARKCKKWASGKLSFLQNPNWLFWVNKNSKSIPSAVEFVHCYGELIACSIQHQLHKYVVFSALRLFWNPKEFESKSFI